MLYNTLPSGHTSFRKTMLALAAGAALTAHAAPLELTQSPPGSTQSYVAPNVIISVDDSGSMLGTVQNQGIGGDMTITAPVGGVWPTNTPRINILKFALKQVFSDNTLLPDGKIRLAWQAMWNNRLVGYQPYQMRCGVPPGIPNYGAGASSGVGPQNTIVQHACHFTNGAPASCADGCSFDTVVYINYSGANNVYSGAGAPVFGDNTMKPLEGPVTLPGSTHRQRFLSFVDGLTPAQGTPAYLMFRQADAYMRAPLSKDGPWALVPGTTAEPYLACRRSYHIVMTDGRWNLTYAAPPVLDNGPTNLGDGTPYLTTDPQTRIYRDSDTTGTVADWAFYSWSQPMQTVASPSWQGTVQPSADYTSAPPTENFGGVALQKFWNPKYDPATWPHMVTFTIGFSKDAVEWPGNCLTTPPASSDACDTTNTLLPNAVNRISAPSSTVPFGYDGSFPNLITGAKLWPNMGGPDNEEIHGLDLWHAAINGRGRFYAVTQPADLEKAFREIIQSINTENEPNLSTSAASGFNSTRNDVDMFIAGYDPNQGWMGYVKSSLAKPDGSIVSNWGGMTTAQKLDVRTSGNRQILTWSTKWTSGGGTGSEEGGVPFKYSSINNKTQQVLMSKDPVSNANDGNGNDRVEYLRGDRSKEGSPFRVRKSLQGDIVNSWVWYVAGPISNYAMNGYPQFIKTRKNRTPMLYVGGNDGMLHGFDAGSGEEKFAYVPRGVYFSLNQLTNPGYTHQYYVDGSPVSGDVDLASGGNNDDYTGSSNWKTYLVGTLGAGGRGYFVLDVTDPNALTQTNANTVVLLDRTRGNAETVSNMSDICPSTMSGPELAACQTSWNDDKDIGNIIAPPVMDDNNGMRSTQIARMNNNRWAVVLGNGYKSPNQRPVLLIQYLDGSRELKMIPVIGTVSGTGFTPGSGLAAENGLAAPRLVDINGDGRVDVVYAGDNLGNMWKFDLTSSSDASWNVATFGNATPTPLFTATGPATMGGGARNKVQPIFAPPTVRANDRYMTIGSNRVAVGGTMVAFGTGRNVFTVDGTDENVQTLYSVLDNTRYETYSSMGGKRLKLATSGGTCPGADCVPAPHALGTGVIAANLAEQKITAISGDFSTVDFGTELKESTWNGKNGWYLDLPATGERLLKPMEFYDGSNILAVYSQVPAKGVSADGGAPATQESCEGTSVADEIQYRTLVNIMDGKRPSVQLVDMNGDGLFNISDQNAARRKVTKGAHTRIVQGKKVLDTDANGAQEVMARMPEQSLRPNWRSLK